MVRVEQIEGNTHPKSTYKGTLGVFPSGASLRSRASLQSGASRYNAAPVLITAYNTAWTHLRPPVGFVWSSQGHNTQYTHDHP